MSLRKKHNAVIKPWLIALAKNNGALLINTTEQQSSGLYWLGAMWAEDRGLLIRHDTADVISDQPRRYSYTLTAKGKRAAQAIMR